MPGAGRGPEARRLALAANRERLAELYGQHRRYTVNYIARRVQPQHSHVVEDLAQDTFRQGVADVGCGGVHGGDPAATVVGHRRSDGWWRITTGMGSGCSTPLRHPSRGIRRCGRPVLSHLRRARPMTSWPSGVWPR